MATPVLFAQTVRGARAKSRLRTAAKRPRRHRVGVLDVDTYALLRPVLDRVNRAQTGFEFAQVTTTLPTGIGLMSARVLQIAKDTGFEPNANEIEDLEQNVFFDDFVPFLEQIRDKLKLNSIVALVTPMLAFVDDENTFQYNLFSVSNGGVVMVSAFALRDYAKKAKRPFEACIAALMATQVWAGLFEDVDYHEETRGCLYDLCTPRDDIVKGLTKMRISEGALALFPESERADVQKAVQAIAEYKR